HRSLRAAFHAHRNAGPAEHPVPAQPASAAVAGDYPRARDDAALGDDARRAAARCLPARPVAALSSPRLFVVRVRAADDAGGDRELPRIEARDGEPAVLALSTRR